MPAEQRSLRVSALEEKKRRLEELKARRSVRSTETGGGVNTTNQSLDEYIDGLLNSVPPGAATTTTTSSVSFAEENTSTIIKTSTSSDENNNLQQQQESLKFETPQKGNNKDESSTTNTNIVSTPMLPRIPPTPTPVKKVETFVASTQTDEDDFPIPQPRILQSTTTNDTTEFNDTPTSPPLSPAHKSTPTSPHKQTQQQEEPQSKILSSNEVNSTVSSQKFSTFFNSASKQVERLLGSPILSQLLVDDSNYYTDLQTKRNAYSSSSLSQQASNKSHPLVSASISFSCPSWTAGRDVTSIDWSPHHRGEVMVSSHHMPYLSYSSSSLSSTMTAISSLHNPKFIPSSSLNNNNNTITTTTSTNHNNDQLLSPSPNNSTLQHSYSNYADGLTLLWNLTMPNRPEHVFTCGSPVLNAKFHPSEAHLVIGACYSGQVVVWDVRSGRLPVQRSSLNVLGNSSGIIGSGSGKRSMMGGGGHVHPIVGMEVIESGSGLVTAASDGQLNFWSFSNLYDPAESIVVPGANISSLAIAPETQSILVGDECGNIHAISSSNASNSANNGGTTIEDTSNSTKITSRTSGGSSSTRRFIRKLQPNLKSTPGNEMSSIPSSQESQLACHYGMVTGLSTRNHVKGNQSAIGLSRGFARGAKGLVLSCGVDWTVKLWSPAISDKPLLTFLSHSYDYMSDVQWSPAHPSVFATASSNGTLGLWNLASSIDDPISGSEGIVVEIPEDKESKSLNTNISRGLNKIKWSSDGRRIVAASSDTLHVLGLAEDVWKHKSDDEARMMSNLIGRGLLDEE